MQDRIQLHRFAVNGRADPFHDEQGNPTSLPDALVVAMTRRDALDLLVSLANQLNRPEEAEIEVSWVGRMERVGDDEDGE